MEGRSKRKVLDIILKNWVVRLGGAAFYLYLARSLPVDELGVVSLYILVFNAVELLCDFGVSDAIANDKVREFKIAYYISLIGVVSSLSMLSIFVASGLGELSYYGILVVVCFSILTSYSQVVQGFLRREALFNILSKRSMFSILGALITGLAFQNYFGGVGSILTYYFTLSFIMFLCSVYYKNRIFEGKDCVSFFASLMCSVRFFWL